MGDFSDYDYHIPGQVQINTPSSVAPSEPVMKEDFYAIMTSRIVVSTYFNLQCIIMNTLLLTFLFSYQEFRK